MMNFGDALGGMMGIGGFEQNQINQMPKPMMPTMGSAIQGIFGGGGNPVNRALGAAGPTGIMAGALGGAKPISAPGSIGAGMMPKVAPSAPAPKLFGHEAWLARGKQPRPGKY